MYNFEFEYRCRAEHYASNESEALEKLFSHVVDGLGYQYHTSWGQVLEVLSDLFEAAGAPCSKQLCKFLPLLADRRAGDNFHFTNELDYAVGKAIRCGIILFVSANICIDTYRQII